MLYTCPNVWCNSCSKCYGMDCFGTYFTHVQTCDATRVQCATEWTRQFCDHEVLSSMAMEVWKCLVPWLVQDHSKNVPNQTWQKVRRKCSRYYSETKNASKNEPHFQGPKNMDMLQFHANNHVLVTFFFPAHCNCADFRDFFQIAMLQNHENFHVFQLFTTDVFQ